MDGLIKKLGELLGKLIRLEFRGCLFDAIVTVLCILFVLFFLVLKLIF